MRLLLTSLVAGGCFLAGATVATADEIRLDDAALDSVSAGATTIDQRRNALLGIASLELAAGIVAKYNQNPDPSALPVIQPIVGGLSAFGLTRLQAAGPDAIALWF